MRFPSANTVAKANIVKLLFAAVFIIVGFENCGGSFTSLASGRFKLGLRASGERENAGQHLIFTHPNTESDLAQDWDQAFDKGQQWTGTLSQTDVIQIWEYDLPSFKTSSIQHLVAMANRWQSLIGSEMQPLDADGCVAGADAESNIQSVAAYTSRNVLSNLALLYSAGGSMAYAGLDSDGINSTINNPGTPNNCNFTVAQAIRAQVLFMQQVHAIHPEIKFGLVPNFPNYNYNGTPCFTDADGKGNCLNSFRGQDYANVLNSQVAAAQNAGEQFWFVHVDNPYMYTKYTTGGINVIQDRLMTLERQVQDLGLRFGVIINEEDGDGPATASTDQVYHDHTLQYIRELAAADQGGADDFIYESWFGYPGHILPETTPNTFTADANEAIWTYRSVIGDSTPAKSPLATANPIAANPIVAQPLAPAPPSPLAAAPASQDDSSQADSSDSASADQQAAAGQSAAAQVAANQAAAAQASAAQAAATQASVAAAAAAAQQAAAQAAADQANAAAAAQAAQAAADLQAAQAAAFAARSTVVINRYVSPRGYHLFARSDGADAVPANFTLEGPVFNLYTASYASTAALYKCNTSGHQFLSTDSGCEGQTVVGRIGYISTAPVQGSAPLYRMREPSGDYIEANDQSVLGAGYSLDGPLGFTP